LADQAMAASAGRGAGRRWGAAHERWQEQQVLSPALRQAVLLQAVLLIDEKKAKGASYDYRPSTTACHMSFDRLAT
jgi:hypothetical protein